jgi:putative transport protein
MLSSVVTLFGALANAAAPAAGSAAGPTTAPSNFFFQIFPSGSMSLTVLTIALVAATGLALGSLKWRGISLGIPGVMFTGLVIVRLLGRQNLDSQVIAFVRDFGLILFVYAVGVQVGPGFFANLRKNGLPLNLMAAAIVLLGAAICVAFAFAFGNGDTMDIKAAVGLFAGATTNAPAVGSAAEALKSVMGPQAGVAANAARTLPAFAIAYPFGLLGVTLAMVVLRLIFRADPKAEADALEHVERQAKPELAAVNIELKNPNLHNLPLGEFPGMEKYNVVVSRVRHGHAQTVAVARPETKVQLGDVLLAVGPAEEVSDFRALVGEVSPVDLRTVPSRIVTRAVVVTHKDVLGETVDDLNLPARHGVTITRITRSGLEFTAVGEMKLQFGDRVRMVGEPEHLDAAAKVLGDSVRELNHPRMLPIFVGIVLGVILGSIPVAVPSLPAPVKLGLAAGPMLVAIVLARLGKVGPLIYYMPHSASQLLREFGIILFLIAVGLQAGDGFFDTLKTPLGLYWLGLGAVVTLVPLIIVGLFARWYWGVNYLHVCGLLCGSMTSPSLAFVHTFTHSEAPAVAFATVYPLTMILRVLVAQIIVLAFA